MNRLDIPFSNDDAHRFLPWLIGMMAGMAALLLCLVVSINGWIVDRHGSYSNSFTVNIPADSDDAENKAKRIDDTLKKMPGAITVNRLGQDRLLHMLEPWLGNSPSLAELPLPTVYDVTFDEKTAPDYDKLQKQLAAIAPGTEVDAHERWVAAFSHFSSAAQWLVSLLATFIIGAMVIIICFTSRASLKLHGKTVGLLHSIGAEDGYIARQFQQEVFRLALYGAVFGCAGAGIVYWLAGMYMQSLQASLLPVLSMGFAHLYLLVLMPLACGLVALLAARISVLRQLRRVL